MAKLCIWYARTLLHMQDSTRYDKTQKLLEKYDPDYEVPTPRKLPPAPLPRQSTPGPMTPLPHQVTRSQPSLSTCLLLPGPCVRCSALVLRGYKHQLLGLALQSYNWTASKQYFLTIEPLIPCHQAQLLDPGIGFQGRGLSFCFTTVASAQASGAAGGARRLSGLAPPGRRRGALADARL